MNGGKWLNVLILAVSIKRKSFERIIWPESLKRIYVVYTNNQSVFITTGIRKWIREKKLVKLFIVRYLTEGGYLINVSCTTKVFVRTRKQIFKFLSVL